MDHGSVQGLEMKTMGEGTGMRLNDLALRQKREGPFPRVFGFDILHLNIQIENEGVTLRGRSLAGRIKKKVCGRLPLWVRWIIWKITSPNRFLFSAGDLEGSGNSQKEISDNEFFSPYGIAATRRELHIFQKKIKTTTKSRARMK